MRHSGDFDGDGRQYEDEFADLLGALSVKYPSAPGKMTDDELKDWRDSRRRAREKRSGQTVNPSVGRQYKQGFCYFVAVRDDAHNHLESDLGFNPWLADVQGWLQDNLSVWSNRKFKATYGLPRLKEDSRPYIQLHLEECATGIGVKELLFLQGGNVRVGMSDGVQGTLHAAAGSAGPSSLHVTGPPGGVEIRVPFFVLIKNTEPRVCFAPRTSSTVKAAVQYFESAELVGFEMTTSIIGGPNAMLGFAVGSSVTAVRGIEGILGQPLSATFSGSSQGAGVGEFILPPDHGFGREVKAVAVGNPDPVFHWFLDSGDPAVANVRGAMKLRVRGHGVASPVQLPTSK